MESLRAHRAVGRLPARLDAAERTTWRVGMRAFERGDVETAIEHLTRLVATRPRFADVHYLLGVLYQERGDLDEAANRLETALALNPRYAEARLALGCVYEQRGEFERARELADGAPRDPTGPVPGIDPLTQARLANLQAALADALLEAGDRAEAIATYRRALARCPHFHDIRLRLGIALREAGLPDQAAREFERILRANPGYWEARMQLGLTSWGLGRWRQAREHWRTVLELDPRNEGARLYLSLGEGEALHRD